MNFRTNILILIIAGTVIRLIAIFNLPLTSEEVHQIILSRSNDFMEATRISADAHPPLNLLILKIWQIFSQNICYIRTLSLIFGILTILSTAVISKKLFDKNVGLLAAFLVTISPSLIYYSATARMYSLAIFEFVLVIYYFIRFLNRKSGSFPLIALLLAGLYTHFFFVILFFILNLYFILYKHNIKNTLKNLVSADFIILVFFIPAITAVLTADRSFPVPLNIFQKFPFFYSAPIVPWDLITSFRIVVLGEWDVLSFLGIFLCFVSIILFFLSAYLARSDKRTNLLSFVFIITPVLTLIFSIIFFRIWAVRSYTIFSPLFFILVAYSISKLSRLKRFFVLFFITFLISIILILYFKTNLGHNNISSQIYANFGKNDAIVYNDPSFFLSTRLTPLPGKHFLIHQGPFSDESLKILGVEISEFQNISNNYDRIWYVKRPTNWPPYDEVADNWEDLLQNNLKEVERKLYLNIQLILYEK